MRVLSLPKAEGPQSPKSRGGEVRVVVGAVCRKSWIPRPNTQHAKGRSTGRKHADDRVDCVGPRPVNRRESGLLWGRAVSKPKRK